MKRHSITIESWPALGVTVFFGFVTGFVLFNDVIHAAQPLAAITIKHVMTLAVLIGTMFFGHQIIPAWHRRKLLAMVGCAALFLAGTSMCVFLQAGRSAEVASTKNSEAQKSNDDRARLEKNVSKRDADRADAKAAVAAAVAAQTLADAAMRTACAEKDKNGKPNVTGCKATASAARMAAETVGTARDAAETADRLYWEGYGKLATTPAKLIENAEYKAAAGLLATIGLGETNAIEALIVLLAPFGQALFCEISCLVGFSLAFGSGTVSRVSAPVSLLVPHNDGVEPDPEPGNRDQVVNWVREFQARNGRKPMIPEVRRQFQLPKTTAWRRIKAA